MNRHVLAVCVAVALGYAYFHTDHRAVYVAPNQEPAKTEPANVDYHDLDPSNYLGEWLESGPTDGKIPPTVDYSFALHCEASDTAPMGKGQPPSTIDDGEVTIAYNHGEPDPYSDGSTYGTTVINVTPNSITVGYPWANHGFFDRTTGEGAIYWGGTWAVRKVDGKDIDYFHKNKEWDFKDCKAASAKF